MCPMKAAKYSSSFSMTSKRRSASPFVAQAHGPVPDADHPAARFSAIAGEDPAARQRSDGLPVAGRRAESLA
jgi:hypothetical protein